MDSILQERLKIAMKSLNMTPRAVSIAAGLGPDAVRIILDGRSLSPRADRLTKIAKVLGTTVQYLIGESDQLMSTPEETDSVAMAQGLTATSDERAWQRAAPIFQDLPIRHEVSAGAWIEADDQYDEPIGTAPAVFLPQYEHCRQWLERVVGSSVNKLGIVDGSLVHVVDAIDLGYEPIHGDIVVVTRTRAQGALVERTVKQVAVVRRGIELWGRSHDDRYNVAIQIKDGVSPAEEDVEVRIVGKVVRSYIAF